MNKKAISVIKIVLGVLGVGITIANDYIKEQEFDEKVAEAVAEKLAESK